MTPARPSRAGLLAAILIVVLGGLLVVAGCSCGDAEPVDEADPNEEASLTDPEAADGEKADGEEKDGEEKDSEEVDGEEADAEPVDEADSEEPITEESSIAPLKRHSVQIYFPSASGNGLIAERREIFETVTPGDRAKQIVADLIAGPSSKRALRAVPRGTILRQAYVLDSGEAYLDFSRELSEGTGGGSMEELLTVYAIVDSVVKNVPEIKRVGILVDGDTIETLNGHMDLRRALPPNYDLILRTRAQGPQADPHELRAGALPVNDRA